MIRNIIAIVLMSPLYAHASDALQELQYVNVFIIILFCFSGLVIIAKALIKIVNYYDDGGGGGTDKKTLSTYIQYLLLGIGSVSIAIIIELTSNSLFGTGQNESVDFISAVSAESGQIPDPESFKEHLKEASSIYGIQEPATIRLLSFLFGMVKIGGLLALFKAKHIWEVALISGSDMGGTSLTHKTSTIVWHIIGGILMINITSTLSLLQNTGQVIIKYLMGMS